jgi:hypothetical protein
MGLVDNSTIWNKITGLLNDNSTLQGKVSELINSNNSMNTRVNIVELNNISISARLGALEISNQTLTGWINQLLSSNSSMNGRMNSVEASIVSLDLSNQTQSGKIAELINSNQSTNNKIDQLNSTVISDYAPYSGATKNINLGSKNLTSDWYIGNTSINGVKNVRYYGARGDSVTNDQLAFQAAVDAAGENGSVYIPCGVYNLTSSTTGAVVDINHNNMRIFGEGPCSRIRNDVKSETPWLYYVFYVNTVHGIEISNIYFTGISPTTTDSENMSADGIYVSYSYDVNLHDMYMQGGREGIITSGSDQVQISNIIVEDAEHGINLYNVNGVQINNFIARKTSSTKWFQRGIVIMYATDVVINNFQIEDTDDVGIFISIEGNYS